MYCECGILVCLCEAADSRYTGKRGDKTQSLVTKRGFFEEYLFIFWLWFWNPGKQFWCSPPVSMGVQWLLKQSLEKHIKLCDFKKT